MGHFGGVLPSQSFGVVLKKLTLTQQKQTTRTKESKLNQKNTLNKRTKTKPKLEMWANAQRDGRPAEYRWCPLFNAAKFG